MLQYESTDSKLFSFDPKTPDHPPSPTWQKAPSSHLSLSKRPPEFHSPICFSTSAASSAVALGRMPGSVKLVLSREKTTNTNSNPPITGMNTVRCSTRNGQLLRQRSFRVIHQRDGSQLAGGLQDASHDILYDNTCAHTQALLRPTKL